MKSISVQVTYRAGRPFAAYIDLGRRRREKTARSVEISPEIVVDFARDERPIGIELVSPEAVTLDEVLEVFDQLGIARPDPSELAPLHAA